jgi:hypothetical protein
MATNSNGIISPLNLEAGAGLLNNQGIGVGTGLTVPIAEYNATTILTKLLAINTTAVGANITSSTRTALQTMGASTCPALGGAVPTAYQNTNYPILPIGGTPKLIPASQVNLFGGIVLDKGNVWMGSGDNGKFAQAYFSSAGYISLVNPFIISAVNANDNYLGPTFTTMDDLITGDLAFITLALTAFGQDIAKLGTAIDLTNLDNMGSPAALLAALSKAGNMPTGTLPAVRTALQEQGLTNKDIQDLVTNNQVSLFNPTGLTPNNFNTLQKKAYPALCTITGDNLTDVLNILDVTTPNITQMCELLNPVKIFPTSWPSITVPTSNGPVLVYNADGSVNGEIDPIVNSGALLPVGCDELAKIVPPANAVGSKAVQISLQQVKNISSLTLPQLAAVLT